MPRPDPELIAERLSQCPPRCGIVRVLAIDGGAAAGKTTLANAVAAALPGAETIHTDDVLDGWDDEFSYWPRLRHVLATVARGERAEVPRYDWHLRRFGSSWSLDPPPALIVEGVSAIRACGPFLSLGVLIEVPRAERERRWRERDGALGEIQHRWLDREDAYFTEPIPVDVPILRIAG